MRDVLTFTFEKGYYDTGNVVNVPEGAIVAPSSNVYYDSIGRLMSAVGAEDRYPYGGTRAFVIDKDRVAFLGSANNSTTANIAIGNLVQGVGKSIWFVGNNLSNAVRVVDTSSTGSLVPIGGTYHSERVQVTSSTSYAHTTATSKTADASTDIINYTDHPFIDGQKVTFASGAVPEGLTADTVYYVRDAATDTFKLSDTNGGAVKDITGGDGQSVTVKSPQFRVIVSGSDFGSPVNILVETSGSGETDSSVASKIVSQVWLNTSVTSKFFAKKESETVSSVTSTYVVLTDKSIRTLASLNIEIASNLCGVTAQATSSVVTTGGTDDAANLSTTPQFCKWDYANNRWDNPVQIGQPEIEDAPTLSLTTTSTRSAGFSGLIIGSRSVRVARKRYGGVSTATPSSNVVTAAETGDTLVVTIPPYPADASPKDANAWLLYFTYSGLGSTATHKLFPIEIPEAELDGSAEPVLHELGNAKYKVIKQGQVQADRQVEVEFNDNELALLEPYEDFFPMEPCKFITKLGNVMCAIGSGFDATGFDVSYPNNYEAYTPDWRDWFAEVPVAVAQEADQGVFWVCTANQSYMASWTGVTEGAAPVVIEKVSPLYGAIGIGAAASIRGNLFTLTNGKRPVMISQDGQIDINFGVPVLNQFKTYFDSETHVSYDEITDSVVYICKGRMMMFGLGTELWSTPIILDASFSNRTRAVFTLNGHVHWCRYSSGAFDTKRFNTGTAATGWNVTSAFSYGQQGRALKDIIQVEAVISSTTTSPVDFKANKNFSTAAPVTLVASVAVPAGSSVTVRKFVESLDYDSISATITGSSTGPQTIHMAMYTTDVHNIERVT